MRRSKVKATICVGRKKSSASKKPKEVKEEEPLANPALNEVKSELNEHSEGDLQENTSSNCESPAPVIGSKTSDEINSTPSSVKLSPDSKSTAAESSFVNIKSERPSSPLPIVTSKDVKPSEVSVSNEESSKNIVIQDVIVVPPNSERGAVTSIGNQEKLHVPPNTSILKRSRIKAVPKIRVRKTAANTTSESAEEVSSVANLSEEDATVDSNICNEKSEKTLPTTCALDKEVSKTDYIPPPSPSKLCRNRIKVIPVLGNRRHHAASDSEDANKRIRTESQSSSISGIPDISDDAASAPKKVDNLDVRRKFKKSEGSKKLAEARKEFAKKFSDSEPDLKKLTMRDLIFYNPTTNPMKDKSKKQPKKISDSAEEAEDVDNPSEPTNNEVSQENDPTEKSDDEDEVIAPRIKIDAETGKIIIDEKSLVIENKKAKRAAEAIEKSKLYDGDADRPYGVRGRFTRTKWSHSETLKFYRALSSVGTNFTLMEELFSNRTRRELKLKFKIEERKNRELVDQAIMKPCSFNFKELKSEFKMMEIEEQEIEQQQTKEKELKKNGKDKKTRKFTKLMEDNTSSEADATGEKSNNIKRRREKKTKLPKLPKPTKPRKKMDIFSAMSESEDSGDDSDVSLVIPSTRTTRYGRKTKRREIFEPNVELEEEVIIRKRIRTTSPVPEPVQKPGSLMVVSSKTSDGQPLVKIFMVTGDKDVSNEDQKDSDTNNLLPIAMIRTDHTDEEEITENNYTIPADTEGSSGGKIIENNESKEKEESEIISVISEETH